MYSAQTYCYAYCLYQLTFNLDDLAPAVVSECGEIQCTVVSMDWTRWTCDTVVSDTCALSAGAHPGKSALNFFTRGHGCRH